MPEPRVKPELPRYRLLEPAFLTAARSSGPAKFEAGAEVAFEGAPTFAMAPLNAAANAAKATSIRARGMKRIGQPSAGDRSALITLTQSIGGRPGAVDEMTAAIDNWLAANPEPTKDHQA